MLSLDHWFAAVILLLGGQAIVVEMRAFTGTYSRPALSHSYLI